MHMLVDCVVFMYCVLCPWVGVGGGTLWMSLLLLMMMMTTTTALLNDVVAVWGVGGNFCHNTPTPCTTVTAL